ncbi:MAG: family 20 glycosylhydrolase [Crocinitomicaceae bacterium]|nr:family 20 glycosylhydrolase [Crocinitomicaceae bacterium]
MKIFLSLLAVLIMSIATAQNECPIIPTPTIYTQTGGDYLIPALLEISILELDESISKYLMEQLETYGIQSSLTIRGMDISYYLDSKLDAGEYHIDIDENIAIGYGDVKGAFYATNSILQLISAKSQNNTLPKCRIEDKPKFEWRGLHLDVSRHFFPVDDIKKFLRTMAQYKFNVFHWHLTDDQGWRIEIKKYPKLTEIGGYRDSTVIGHYSDSPRKYDTEEYGGFYSQEDVKEIVAYADSLFITVVPEIELPGHSRAALAAYPEFSCTGEEQPVPGLWGIFDDIYCSKKESIEFMKDILAEVLELFPSEYIHIGGDEAPKTRWKKCENCQRVIEENGLHDEHELQSYFIGQMDEFLTSKGRKLIGWDEILEGGLSPNAAVMSWRGEAGGIEAAKQGHYVVMSPTTYCYFDYYQSGGNEPLAIGGYLPLEKVYKYNPIPEELAPAEHKYVLGGQANLWTEYMPDMDHVEYMAFPRALALIQSLWCENKPEYEVFLANYLKYHESYLNRIGVNYATSIHFPEPIIERTATGISLKFKGATDDAIFGVKISGRDQSLAGQSIMTSRDAIVLDRVDASEEFVKSFDVSSKKYDGTVNFNFVMNAHLGIPIELISVPHPKYNHNGSLNMVDGIRRGEQWKGSEWLGFRDSLVEFIIDLGEERKLKEIAVGILDNNGSWIYVPERITVMASHNNRDWNRVEQKGKILEDAAVVTMEHSARYFRIQLSTMGVIPEGMDGAGNAPWTFIDEIKIVEAE